MPWQKFTQACGVNICLDSDPNGFDKTTRTTTFIGDSGLRLHRVFPNAMTLRPIPFRVHPCTLAYIMTNVIPKSAIMMKMTIGLSWRRSSWHIQKYTVVQGGQGQFFLTCKHDENILTSSKKSRFAYKFLNTFLKITAKKNYSERSKWLYGLLRYFIDCI